VEKNSQKCNCPLGLQRLRQRGKKKARTL